MSRKFKYWLDSGANRNSCRKEWVTLDEIGIPSEEFDAMSEDEKDDVFREYAFERADWGWIEE